VDQVKHKVAVPERNLSSVQEHNEQGQGKDREEQS
jgi:hypothetical protein